MTEELVNSYYKVRFVKNTKAHLFLTQKCVLVKYF